MCLDCNNSLCSLDILPSLSISTSFPITSSLLFSHRPSICWSLCLRFSCDSFVNHALLSCSLFWFFLLFLSFSFPLSYLCTALPPYCFLFCCLPTLCLWRPSYLCLSPFPLFLPVRLSFFAPSYSSLGVCLSGDDHRVPKRRLL